MTKFGTLTGRFLDFEKPHPSQINLYDIALGLSREMRFAGQTEGRVGYSVGAHSLMCVHLAKDIELKQIMLLHDGSEAYMRDIPSGLKKLLPDYKRIEQRVQDTIWDWAGVSLVYVASRYDEMKAIDELACRSEQWHLRSNVPRHSIPTGSAGHIPLNPFWDDELRVRQQFVATFLHLFGKEPIHVRN